MFFGTQKKKESLLINVGLKKRTITQITFFIGGIPTIPKWVVYRIALPTSLRYIELTGHLLGIGLIADCWMFTK